MRLFFLLVELERETFTFSEALAKDAKIAIKGTINHFTKIGYDFWFIRNRVWAIPIERVLRYDRN